LNTTPECGRCVHRLRSRSGPDNDAGTKSNSVEPMRPCRLAHRGAFEHGSGRCRAGCPGNRQPSNWMKPLVRGTEIDLIETPANWYLDDLPPIAVRSWCSSCAGLTPRSSSDRCAHSACSTRRRSKLITFEPSRTPQAIYQFSVCVASIPYISSCTAQHCLTVDS